MTSSWHIMNRRANNKIWIWYHNQVTNILYYTQARVCTIALAIFSRTLQWRHNGCDGVSNHQPHDCSLKRLSRRGSKKTSKLRVIGLVRGIHRWPVNSAQLASSAENISIWWRNHVIYNDVYVMPRCLCSSRLLPKAILSSLVAPEIVVKTPYYSTSEDRWRHHITRGSVFAIHSTPPHTHTHTHTFSP